MGHFLDVAYRVLSKAEHPLSAKEITEIGRREGFLKTSGKTPHQTMKSKLSTNILKEKHRSAFLRTEKGLFGLREWKDQGKESEYVADRFQKSLLEEDAVVFSATSLSKYIPGPGLHMTTLENSKNLLEECRAMSRRVAEEDFSVIQLISVFVLRYKSRYLTYKRTKRLPESRLHGFYSLVFGGHVSPEEVFGEPLQENDTPPIPFFDIFRPKEGAALLVRELREEVRFREKEFPSLKYKGLLFDDKQELSLQHLGIVYDVFLKSEYYEIGERGFLMDSKFETIDEIEARLDDFENWSILIARHERQSLTLQGDPL